MISGRYVTPTLKIMIIAIFNIYRDDIFMKMGTNDKNSNKNKLKEAKLLKSLKANKPRVPVPPPSFAHKSKKDYKRSDNKKVINKELKNND